MSDFFIGHTDKVRRVEMGAALGKWCLWYLLESHKSICDSPSTLVLQKIFYVALLLSMDPHVTVSYLG